MHAYDELRHCNTFLSQLKVLPAERTAEAEHEDGLVLSQSETIRPLHGRTGGRAGGAGGAGGLGG